MIFSWFFLFSNLETVINLGLLFWNKFSASSKDFGSISFNGSTPGLITIIFSLSTPQLIARFLVNCEFETT